MSPSELLKVLDWEVAARVEKRFPGLQPLLHALDADRRRLTLPVLLLAVPVALEALGVALGFLRLAVAIAISFLEPQLGTAVMTSASGIWAARGLGLFRVVFYVPVLVVGWIVYAPFRDRTSLRIRSRLLGEVAPALGFVPFQPEPQGTTRPGLTGRSGRRFVASREATLLRRGSRLRVGWTSAASQLRRWTWSRRSSNVGGSVSPVLRGGAGASSTGSWRWRKVLPR